MTVRPLVNQKDMQAEELEEQDEAVLVALIVVIVRGISRT